MVNWPSPVLYRFPFLGLRKQKSRLTPPAGPALNECSNNIFTLELSTNA